MQGLEKARKSLKCSTIGVEQLNSQASRHLISHRDVGYFDMSKTREQRWGQRWGNILAFADRDQDKSDLIRDLDETEMGQVVAWLNSWKDDLQREQDRRLVRERTDLTT